MEVKILGKIIGEAENWDQIDEDTVGYVNFKINEFGKKVFENYTEQSSKIQGDKDLDFNSINGKINLYDREGSQFNLTVNWTMFNEGVN